MAFCWSCLHQHMIITAVTKLELVNYCYSVTSSGVMWGKNVKTSHTLFFYLVCRLTLEKKKKKTTTTGPLVIGVLQGKCALGRVSKIWPARWWLATILPWDCVQDLFYRYVQHYFGSNHIRSNYVRQAYVVIISKYIKWWGTLQNNQCTNRTCYTYLQYM